MQEYSTIMLLDIRESLEQDLEAGKDVLHCLLEIEQINRELKRRIPNVC